MFLVVDGWGTLRQEYEELEPTITDLATRGLGYGVHVVLTATRWAEIRINLRDLFGTRLELRLGDPSDSEVDRRAAANVPESTPGRGLTRDKLHFLAALPRLDGSGRRRPGRRHRRPGGRVARGLAAATGPGVRLLPRHAARGRALAASPTRPTRRALPIGIDETAPGAGVPRLRRRPAPDRSSATRSAARPTCCG